MRSCSSLKRVSPASNCVILGGGSHAKVIIDAIQSSDESPYAVLDADPSRWGNSILGVRVLGGDDLLPGIVALGIKYFSVGVGSVGNTRARRELFDLGVRHGLTPLTIKHASAIRSATAMVHNGAQLLAGSIVNTCASIGENVIVNSGAIVEHDCQVGSHVHISPGVRLAGHVQIGEDSHVGIGATVRQGIMIGPRSVVGAGSVVVENVPPDVVVVGVPARIYSRVAA